MKYAMMLWDKKGKDFVQPNEKNYVEESRKAG